MPASLGMVRAIMRDEGLSGVQPRLKKRTTIPADDAEARPDLLRRDFTAEAPGTRLVGDITYLRTGEGWLFLATVIDLYSRMVVGWAMAGHMRTELVSDALRMAHTHGHIQRGAIFHSDRGVRFRSRRYRRALRRHNLLGSMGRMGAHADNAAIENWFSLLQKNVLNQHSWDTREQLRLAIVHWIEARYHRRRQQR